ncbi:MAG: Rossmann-like and DUF2520 domain-containing protein [Runella sp.]
MRISFVGAGNVAWHLAQALEQAGHHIIEIFSRHKSHARSLAHKLYDTQVVSDLDFSESEAEVIILAVPDDAHASVMSQIVLPENCLLVHTSGTKSLSHLEELVEIYSDVPAQTGVFYPLQTFSKEVAIDFSKVPICIEASSHEAEQILVQLAHDLSDVVYLMTSQERKVVHLAAVFACNFTNHLLAISKQLLEREQLEFELLKPLISETIRKALQAPDPALVQTGPARRGDYRTIEAHLDYLQTSPDWQRLYEMLTEGIIKQQTLHQ